jgi:hypothetical protein
VIQSIPFSPSRKRRGRNILHYYFICRRTQLPYARGKFNRARTLTADLG